MFLYLITTGCGNPPPLESSLSKPTKVSQETESVNSVETDIVELKEVTSSLQKDMSEMNEKVENLEQMIQKHLDNEKQKE